MLNLHHFYNSKINILLKYPDIIRYINNIKLDGKLLDNKNEPLLIKYFSKLMKDISDGNYAPLVVYDENNREYPDLNYILEILPYLHKNNFTTKEIKLSLPITDKQRRLFNIYGITIILQKLSLVNRQSSISELRKECNRLSIKINSKMTRNELLNLLKIK